MSPSTRQSLAKLAVIALAVPALLAPAACLLGIAAKGFPALHWDLFMMQSAAPVAFGASRILWPQIGGSLLLMGVACMLALPVALGVALFCALRTDSPQRKIVLGLLHLLQGIPPIVYGLCGLILLVHTLNWGLCLLTGAVILAMIILPVLVLNIVRGIEQVPAEITEAARSLGLRDSALAGRVWLPQAWPAMLTGLLLGMARALSETAPILFTATVFSGIRWPDSIFSPVTSLQTHIFYLAQEGANPEAVENAWAAALILVGIVILLSLAAAGLGGMGRNK